MKCPVYVMSYVWDVLSMEVLFKKLKVSMKVFCMKEMSQHQLLAQVKNKISFRPFLTSAVLPYNCSFSFKQCLGSGSVGSARFWLPGSGSAKIYGSTDPDPRGKISTKNCKKELNFTLCGSRIRIRIRIKINWILSTGSSQGLNISWKSFSSRAHFLKRACCSKLILDFWCI